MLISMETAHNYLGNKLHALQGNINPTTLAKLESYDRTIRTEYGIGVIDYFFLSHQMWGIGLKALGEEAGISRRQVERIFVIYAFPSLSSQESLQKSVELGRGFHGADKETRSAYSRMAGVATYKAGKGIHSDRKKWGAIGGRISGKITAAFKKGLHGFHPVTGEPYQTIAARNGGKKTYKLGVGAFGVNNKGVRYAVIGARKGGEVRARQLERKKLAKLGIKSEESQKILAAFDKFALDVEDERQMSHAVSHDSGVGIEKVSAYLRYYLR